MPQTTFANSIRTRYSSIYLEAAMMARLYDQLAQPVEKVGVEQAARLGTNIQVEFLADMVPGTTAISTTADINPQTLRDAKATISPTSRGEALELSEQVDLNVFTNYAAQRVKAVGKNQMETVEILARDVSCQGGMVFRPAARSSLDAGTSTHRLTDSQMIKAGNRLKTLKSPPYIGNGKNQYMAIMHGDPYTDLLAGGNVINALIYQDKESLFAQELGSYDNFKIIVDPWAKVFGAAGAANASAVATTLSSAANALATQIVVASATNIAAGGRLFIGTIETGNTHYVINETVYVSDAYSSGTTIDIIGEGANGGLRFDHASGATVSNADNAYPVVFGGPMSIAKAYDALTGEYGEMVGPKKSGRLEQFETLGWKFYGGYGRWVESWLVRGEFSSSVDA